MTRSFIVLLAIATTLAIGCTEDRERSGGLDGSAAGGLDRSRTIDSLNLAEARVICEDVVESQGGAGTTALCEGVEFTVQTVDDCAASIDAATCTHTVGELEDCAALLEADTCNLLTHEGCAVIRECAVPGD